MGSEGEMDSQQTVLIVDDTPENIALVSSILRGSCRAKVAINGEKALEIAFSADPPDLILLDIMMPGMDGYEVCRRLKDDPRTADIPVIFLTSRSRGEDEKRGFDLGAVDYITKPVNPPIVIARVKTHLALQRQKRLLKESYERLVRLERMRDNLVQMIVHDLRSPLTIVVGYLDLLKSYESEGLSGEALELVGMARSASDTLIEMVSSVLDVSRMEAMDVQLNLRDCCLVELAKGVAEKLAVLARNRKLVLDTAQPSLSIRADADLIARVIQNLVGNAIKFSPASSVITMAAETIDDTARFSVKDSGQGILPEHLDRIFEKFFQVEVRQQKQKYSTGLGLTFCKLAVEAHGGRIGVESERGKGSLFWFELPVNGPQLVQDEDGKRG